MDGYAVIDLETTGFAYNGSDRVCEIGVVLMTPDGTREGAYGTLVNPGRDLGAQHIHGIQAADARVAPAFDAVVGDLTEMLGGRVIVAHNSAFDTAFLVAEYERAGWPLNLTRDMTLCTMRLARDFGGPAKLGDCCAHFGVSLTDAHHALADAEAAAGLLEVYMNQTRDNSQWSNWIAFGSTIQWPAPPRKATSPVPRGVANHGSPMLTDIANSFVLDGDAQSVHGSDEYLDLLDRVLADRKISVPERRALNGLAASLGLDTTTVAGLNRHYLLGVVNAVCADDQLTRQERALVIQLANLLGLQSLEVEALLSDAESKVSTIRNDITLSPGDLIVLTGFPEARKAKLRGIAEARGLVVWAGVKKGVAAVIALDESSNSVKARKARDYGIPVVSESALLSTAR